MKRLSLNYKTSLVLQMFNVTDITDTKKGKDYILYSEGVELGNNRIYEATAKEQFADDMDESGVAQLVCDAGTFIKNVYGWYEVELEALKN